MFRILPTFILVLSLAAPAAAQSGGENTAAARALFQEGMSAVDAGDFLTAVDRLRRSLELRDSQVVRFNLALALLETHRYLEATEHLRLVRRRAEPGSELAEAASSRLQSAEARLGRMRVVVDGDPAGVSARIDGAPMSDALIGVEQPADPGVHRIEIFRGTMQLASSEATVQGGATTEVRLFARPPTEAERNQLADGRPPYLEDDDDGVNVVEQWWFWTILAVVVVGAGVGIGLGIALQDPPQPTIVGDDGTVHMTLVEF